jgi:Rap1a immunity proteins
LLASWYTTKFFLDEDRGNAKQEGVNVFSVGQLVELCQSDQTWKTDACREYAVAGGDIAVQEGRRNGGRHQFPAVACPNDSPSEADYVKAFVEWAEKHPSEKHMDVVPGVAAAMAATWPCAGK